MPDIPADDDRAARVGACIRERLADAIVGGVQRNLALQATGEAISLLPGYLAFEGSITYVVTTRSLGVAAIALVPGYLIYTNNECECSTE